MQSFMNTILSALKFWVKKLIKSNTPDWNQNDVNGDGYIKNRPFFTETTNLVFANNVAIEIVDEPVIDPFPMNAIIEGQTYTVIWDETKYECIAYIAKGPDAPSLGNGGLADVSGGNGEPFFITIFNDVLTVFGYEGEHTITLSVLSENVKKIDTKYLPEVEPIPEGALRPDYNIFNPSEVGYIKNRPCYYDGVEIKASDIGVSQVGMGGYIGSEAVHEHDFIPGCEYRVVGEIAVKYGSYSPVTWAIDLTTTAVSSGVYYSIGGLKFSIKYTLPMDKDVHIHFNGISNITGEYSSLCGKLQGYWIADRNSNSVEPITFESVDLHCYALKQLDEHVIPDTIARKSDLEGLGGSSEVPILTDIATGTRYELYVENGKLTMKEAE